MRKQQLVTEITKHDELYWQNKDPIIPDPDYDRLVEELRSIDPNNKILNKVHGGFKGRAKVIHKIKMLSLSKVYTIPELKHWAKSVARSGNEVFVLSSKKDGLSAGYKGCNLATRGDGITGFNINDRIPYVKNLIEGRGEIVVTKEDFKKAPTRSSGELYKNERSAASGLVNNQKPISNNLLTFVPFLIDGQEYTLDELCEATEGEWEETAQEYQRGPYPLDGLVLSLFDEEYGLSLGETSHHPKHSVAYKFANPTGVTKLIDVVWQVGKHRLSPVAILEPVEISGFMNSKASLFNVDQILKLDLHIGDTVELQRCGEIIPNITKVVKKGDERVKIVCETCPACGFKTMYDSPNLVCDNVECSGSLSKRLQDSINRLGIKNIGPATVDDLVANGVDDLFKLFQMTMHTWLMMPGFAEKSAKAAEQEVWRVKNNPIEDYKVLACLNMTGIGLTLSKQLLSGATLVDLQTMYFNDFVQLSGFSNTRAEILYNGLQSDTLSRLQGILDILDTQGAGKLKTVAFTGKSDKPRKYWIELAESKGWEFKKSVTKDLDLLVLADPNSTSSKSKKAQKNGTALMSYEEFEK